MNELTVELIEKYQDLKNPDTHVEVNGVMVGVDAICDQLISTMKKVNKLQRALKTFTNNGARRVEVIKNLTALYYDIPSFHMTSSKRDKEFVYPRELAIYFSTKHTNMSMSEISRTFNKDKSTIRSAINRIKELSAKPENEVLEDIKNIEKTFPWKKEKFNGNI